MNTWLVTTPYGVNVREGPDVNTKKVAPPIKQGTVLRELRVYGNWLLHDDGWSCIFEDHYVYLTKIGTVGDFNSDTLYFDSPVGTPEERRSYTLWPGYWIDANPYANSYQIRQGVWNIHTGSDLNLNYPSWNLDNRAPFYACADGIVTYSEFRKDSWGRLLVIQHADKLFSRYGHAYSINVVVGQKVSRGEQLGLIGGSGYGRESAHSPHLHFDISKTNILLQYPQHWPGWNSTLVYQHYVDPKKFISQNRPPN